MNRPRAAAHEASPCRKGDTATAGKAGAATSRDRRAAEARPRQPLSRYLREHAVAVSLIGMRQGTITKAERSGRTAYALASSSAGGKRPMQLRRARGKAPRSQAP
jgi:hypothetical protein